MSPALNELVGLLDRGGVIVMLILVMYGGMKGWFVWRREFDELSRDRNWWRSVAMTSLQLGEKAVDEGLATRRGTEPGSVERRLEILEDQTREERRWTQDRDHDDRR